MGIGKALSIRAGNTDVTPVKKMFPQAQYQNTDHINQTCRINDIRSMQLPFVEAAVAMAEVAAVDVTDSQTDTDLHFFVGPTVIGRLVSSKLDQSWHVDLPAEADEQQRQMCWSTSKTFFSVRFSRRYRTTYRLHKTNDEKMKHILIHPSIYTELT